MAKNMDRSTSTSNPSEHLLDMRDRRSRQDAVAEIEDVAAGGERRHHVVDFAVERGAAGQQRKRIDITLHCDTRLQGIARNLSLESPVNADAVRRRSFPRKRNAIALTPRGKPMILVPGIWRRTPSTIFCVGRMHQRSNCSGPSTPAQVSKICTHSAPALSWPTRYSIEACTSRSIRRAEAVRIAIGEQPRRRLIRRRFARHHVGRHRPWRAAKPNQCGVLVKR